MSVESTVAGGSADIPVAVPARPLVSEDWLSVWIAFLMIVLVLGGMRMPFPAVAWKGSADLPGLFSGGNITGGLTILGLFGILSSAAVFLMRGSPPRFAIGFPLVFAVAWVGQIVAGNAAVSAWGFEYVVIAFATGLVISNSVGTPAWLMESVRTEFYIKTGLVILGASILFSDLAKAGLLGIGQALLVVTAVWFVCFWLARRLDVDDEMATMLASAVSICGVSAAIATCGAIQGDRKKLSYVTSLVVVVAAPMMVLMPQIIRAFGIPDVVGGAWLGGTLDTSASVVAAGEMLSVPARNAGIVVKLSQNVLIGVAAFLLTIWWSMRGRGPSAERPGLSIIWERFPKFVLGFIVASLLFSFLLDPSLVADTKASLGGLRTWWFALAFASIGLETRFADLARAGIGRPALAFLGGQAFNVVWTLLLAYLLFGGALFSVPSFS
jgi:uncharacterized integral membrane protein (TIGR00698 family)